MNNKRIREIDQKIQSLCNKLSQTDYKAIKFAEGELTVEEFTPIKEQRK